MTDRNDTPENEVTAAADNSDGHESKYLDAPNMPAQATERNLFRNAWEAGYPDLVPIVPSGAQISPNSTLAKRPGAAGKAPGLRGSDGLWSGFDWLSHTTTEVDLDRWHHMGAGIGFRGDYVPGLDLDVLDEAVCRSLQALAAKMLGETGVRIGKPPKALMPYRTAVPIRWRKLSFTFPDDDRPHAIELIGAERQWVGAGVHPATGKPYHWEKPLLPFYELPEITEAQLDAFFDEADRQLSAIGAIVAPRVGKCTTDHADVDQDGLRGELEWVRKAVRAIPNDNEHFPERDDYLNIGYAIKAALADYPTEAEELWLEWAMKWEGNATNANGNDEENVRADWERMYPPFRRGANWLFELARPHGFNDAAQDFKPLPAEEANAAADIWTPFQETLPPFEWDCPEDYAGDPVPEREWVVEGWIPKGVVTAIYGDGGKGKTLLSQQLANCIAAGLPFLGLPTIKGKVMCFYCEDSRDEIRIRQDAIRRHYQIDRGQLYGMTTTSRDSADNLLCTFDGHGRMQLTPVWTQLRDAAKTFGADVVIVDTAADTFGGDEIKRDQVRRYVQGCLGRLGKEIGGTVIFLAHPSQAGLKTRKGTGGSTAWNNSVRSRLYLDDEENDKTGDFRRLTKMKANYGKPGEYFTLRWEAGAFAVRSGPAGEVVKAGDGGTARDGDAQAVEVLLNLFGPGTHKVKPKAAEIANGLPNVKQGSTWTTVSNRLRLIFDEGERTLSFVQKPRCTWLVIPTLAQPSEGRNAVITVNDMQAIVTGHYDCGGRE